MSPDSQIIFTPIFFLASFLTLWIGITALLSRLSGWSKLSKRFLSSEKVEGEPYRFVSGSIGIGCFPVSYRNCINFSICPTGFFLWVAFPFRFLSPTLFIPWSEITSIAEDRKWFVQRAVITIKDSDVVITFFRLPAHSIAEAYRAKIGGKVST